jgi:AsmA protein
MQDMLIGINADQGLIALEPVQTNLYQGSLRGVANLNVNNALPQFNMQSTLQNINIESLSNDFIGASYASGNGNISLALAGSGSDAQTILANLNGNAELTLAEGILQGVDVGAVLTQLETMIRSRQLLSVQRGEQTAFENLSASVQIENWWVFITNKL